MYYYLDNNIQEIEKKSFICIYVLYINEEEHTHTILRVFTINDKRVKDYLDDLRLFDTDISQRLEYKVKRDGKIGLSFNKEDL